MQSVLISVGISFVILIVMLAVLEAMRRGGWRPVDKLADILKPATPAQSAATGTAA